jgi:hypothetical protein
MSDRQCNAEHRDFCGGSDKMGRTGRIRRAIPYACAVLMWAAAVLGAADGLRPPWDRLLDTATVCVTVSVTVWALLAWHLGGSRQMRMLTEYKRRAVLMRHSDPLASEVALNTAVISEHEAKLSALFEMMSDALVAAGLSAGSARPRLHAVSPMRDDSHAG